MNPKIKHLCDQLDSILPTTFYNDPPMIHIDGDALRVWTGSDTHKSEDWYILPDENNGDVWKSLETEGL